MKSTKGLHLLGNIPEGLPPLTGAAASTPAAVNGNGERQLGDLTLEPYMDKKNKIRFKVQNSVMVKEVLRRAKQLGLKRQVRPSNWKTGQLKTWLKDNPIIELDDDVQFLRRIEAALCQATINNFAEANAQKDAEAKTTSIQFRTREPFLRMIVAAFEDNVRKAMNQEGQCLDHEEFDARNSDQRPPNFWEALAAKYNNDDSWITETEVLPDLQEDFSIVHEIYLTDVPSPVTAEKVEQLVWSYHLYLWHLSDKMDVLGQVVTRLDTKVAASGDKVDTDTSKRKRKRGKNTEEEDDDLTNLRRKLANCLPVSG
ncbi:hypothetical protein SEMRO_78_G042290.1 [Seminavis robusta]|uniref:Uncharacterized protein n=1 Tax=Seminavis robusta TaxID=568900 RepID=A0A9N8DI93_9STRA|nr:hypothetical protein SEMRO_78_G042290.1 [Seminavis robusta]|eukprot:Sro78_g042290.1 n/a (313) ;mRNA; r:6497-7736